MDRIKMSDIKCGDIFWECEDGKNAEFEAMADARVEGDTVTLQGREIATGLPQAFMMRLSMGQYGPKLYNSPQYAYAKTRTP